MFWSPFWVPLTSHPTKVCVEPASVQSEPWLVLLHCLVRTWAARSVRWPQSICLVLKLIPHAVWKCDVRVFDDVVGGRPCLSVSGLRTHPHSDTGPSPESPDVDTDLLLIFSKAVVFPWENSKLFGKCIWKFFSGMTRECWLLCKPLLFSSGKFTTLNAT